MKEEQRMSMESLMKPVFRRVVTGHDANGNVIVLSDGLAENQKFPDAKVSSTMMWSTVATPTDFSGDEDEGARVLGTAPPAGGSRFTMMEFLPGHDYHGMHRTDTVDYVICLEGEIDMFVNEADFVTLKAGDVLIQRGTYHGWANRSSARCRLAVVLLDAVPKRSGSIGGGANAR
ncbi:cupin domain-containing protein [Roseiarcaceae bacterium H3SJ34-1]|uniref:cupin domain-containing protein n=1 Tax=Terripilifer ovatus TaxID=3032367 RepID=UPI003AB99377|nr:cupin domain-containing protein [Roseiarcaceae bacterium H3SJ34-1]